MTKKMCAEFNSDRILPVAVCASTFKNLEGRDATTEELSFMTGISVPMLLRFYLPYMNRQEAYDAAI